MTLNNEKTLLEQKKQGLILNKREIELKLLHVKNLVRSSGTMPYAKYKQCCDSQNKHAGCIVKIEQELFAINNRLREICDKEYSQKKELTPVESLSPSIKSLLIELKDEYQRFASDATRVASMRHMASDFSFKINKILNSDGSSIA